jgi:hypothetical protein
MAGKIRRAHGAPSRHGALAIASKSARKHACRGSPLAGDFGGEGNSFGHPAQALIEPYENRDVPLPGTDRDGAIRAITDGRSPFLRSSENPERECTLGRALRQERSMGAHRVTRGAEYY